jgi:hypothetical protein
MVSLGKPLSQRLGVTCDLRVQNACLAGNRSCVRFIDCPLPRWEMLASAKMNHPEGACYLRCTLHAHFQHTDIWILQVSFQAPTHMFLPNLLLAEPGQRQGMIRNRRKATSLLDGDPSLPTKWASDSRVSTRSSGHEQLHVQDALQLTRDFLRISNNA